MKKAKYCPIFDATFRSDIKKIIELVKSGIDINSLDNDKRTPLIHAVIDKNYYLVQELLINGADPNLKDFQDMTALHFASQNYDQEMCKLLIINEAIVDAKDDNGNTPLWRAEFESHGETSLQNYLISKGADFDMKNFHGVSPRELRDG